MRLPSMVLLMAVRSRLAPPVTRSVSMPVPPSTVASWVVLPPAPMLLERAVMLLALRVKVSLPLPPIMTSAPPLPVRVSLPSPATKVSAVAVPVRVLAVASPR